MGLPLMSKRREHTTDSQQPAKQLLQQQMQDLLQEEQELRSKMRQLEAEMLELHEEHQATSEKRAPDATPSNETDSHQNQPEHESSRGIARCVAAFRRDLPRLLEEHPGQWVAYHLDERVGIDRAKTPLYQKCLARGLTSNDFIVRRIVPDVPRQVEERAVSERLP